MVANARPLARCLVLSLLVLTACAGTRIREFTRESYEPPPGLPPPARVFEAPAARVATVLENVLAARGARFQEPAAPEDRLTAALPWASADAAAGAVDLGQLRKVVTRTLRSYRSYSPLDYRCNECVVRNGRVTSQVTEVVEDRRLVLDPRRYRLEGTVHARLEPVAGGTRVELRLDVEAEPPEPPGLAPRSTNRVEGELLAALAEALAREGPGLR